MNDPFLFLKSIAYARSQLSIDKEKVDHATFVDYARHQICSKKGILFKDPIWERYTPAEVLVEYFALAFDDSEKFRDEFLHMVETGKSIDVSEEEWLESMKNQYEKEKIEEIKTLAGGEDEINESF